MAEEKDKSGGAGKMVKLAGYRDLARQAGLRLRKSEEHNVDPRIISSADVSFENFQGREINEICRTTCPTYGTTAHCANFSPRFENEKRVLQAGEALLVVIKVPTTELADPRWRENAFSGRSRHLLNQVIREVERRAWADGYRDTWGLGSGPCKRLYCPDKSCSLLQPGGKCRAPDLAHPSMESFGINVVETVRKQGLEMFFIGEGVTASDVPYGLSVGLILVC